LIGRRHCERIREAISPEHFLVVCDSQESLRHLPLEIWTDGVRGSGAFCARREGKYSEKLKESTHQSIL
jgi:hypothetical protein